MRVHPPHRRYTLGALIGDTHSKEARGAVSARRETRSECDRTPGVFSKSCFPEWNPEPLAPRSEPLHAVAIERSEARLEVRTCTT